MMVKSETFSCSLSSPANGVRRGGPGYIPSPLSSPHAARRLGQRLADRASPVLSRVRRRLEGAPPPVSDPAEVRRRRGLCGLLAGAAGVGGDARGPTNVYLWSGGDTGRIANRHRDDRWDVW